MIIFSPESRLRVFLPNATSWTNSGVEVVVVAGLSWLLLHVGELGQCAIWRGQESSLEAQLMKSHQQREIESVSWFASVLLVDMPSLKCQQDWNWD